MSTTICIMSGKGGTGKTSTAAGLASALAVAGHKVLALDLDICLRNLDISLALADLAVFDFYDVIMRRAPLDKAVVKHNLINNLDFLSAPLDDLSDEITPLQMAELLNETKAAYEYIIIDCPAGISFLKLLSESKIDLCLILSTPDLASIRDAGIMRQKLSHLEDTEVRLVLNRVDKKLLKTNDMLNLDQAIDKTGVQLIGMIYEDKNVIKAANNGYLIFVRRNSIAAKNYCNISRRIKGERVPIMLK